MKGLDENSKYFTYGIIGGFIIIFIVFLIASLFPLLVTNDSVAIIPIHGEITYTDGGMSPDNFKVILDKAITDNNVKAIVLDIDSSGGNLLASQEIKSYVDNSTKPVVAWISGSGSTYSYLIATSADKIVANPNSVIGTNGFNYLNADLRDYYYKLGINSNTNLGNTFNTIYPNYNNLSASQRNSVDLMLSIDLNYFINTVKEDRAITSNLVNFENGKIYNSENALNNNLIDYIGDESKALEVAADISHINQYHIVNFNDTRSFVDTFMDLISK